MELWQNVQKYRQTNMDMYLGYHWEWFCTLNLRHRTTIEVAELYLKWWRFNMGTKDHILIGYMGVCL